MKFIQSDAMNRCLRLLGLLAVWLSVLSAAAQAGSVLVGAERTELYYPLLQGKRIAVYTNHTGQVDGILTLDRLVTAGFRVTGIFAPEHGFRGQADAGQHVKSSTDARTGIPIWSLYDGKRHKPTKDQMQQFDLLLVDIQDVGLRFYTYYITLFHLMNACAESGKAVCVLDRPNPNGHWVDGPLLQSRFHSGVGCLPIPVLHGMTLGELARMINGEGWLPAGVPCSLHVIPCAHYTHRTPYTLPVPPSPNLPDMKSIYLYPSLCLFEGTIVSLGRGTDRPFQMYGHPDMSGKSYSFTPQSRPGARKPPLMNRKCYGVYLGDIPDDHLRTFGLNLEFVIDAYRSLDCRSDFFPPFFERLIGVGYVRQMIIDGKSADDIRAVWQADVGQFKARRRPYLLYEE